MDENWKCIKCKKIVWLCSLAVSCVTAPVTPHSSIIDSSGLLDQTLPQSNCSTDAQLWIEGKFTGLPHRLNCAKSWGLKYAAMFLKIWLVWSRYSYIWELTLCIQKVHGRADMADNLLLPCSRYYARGHFHPSNSTFTSSQLCILQI